MIKKENQLIFCIEKIVLIMLYFHPETPATAALRAV